MDYESLLKPPESKVLKSGRVRLMPGEEVGSHVTENKEEMLVVLKGEARLVKGSEVITLGEGETHYIPEGVVHNVLNKGESELEYVYVVSLF